MATVLRVVKNKDYVVMSNVHLREREMSLKAKGLLSVILSLPDDWHYSVEGLVSICAEKETSVVSALKELKEFGYLKVDKLMPNQTKSGRIEYVYNIYETPQKELRQEHKKQGLENQGVEFQDIENQGQLNIHNKGIEEESIYITPPKGKDNFGTETGQCPNPQEYFFSNWNISTDDLTGREVGAFSYMNFDKLNAAMEKSKSFLQTQKIARYSSFYIKNYKKIIAGYYDDDKHEPSKGKNTSEPTKHLYDMEAIKAEDRSGGLF